MKNVNDNREAFRLTETFSSGLNDLFVSSNYDIQGLGGHVAVAQRHGDAHLKAEAENRV